MPRSITLAPAAQGDLIGIRQWLLQRGAGRIAQAKQHAIDAALRELARFPCPYRIGDHPGIRERLVAGHTILYRVSPDTGDNATAGDVFVLRVFGAGQSRDHL